MPHTMLCMPYTDTHQQEQYGHSYSPKENEHNLLQFQYFCNSNSQLPDLNHLVYVFVFPSQD